MNIQQEIQTLFQNRDEYPLFYIESGSRLWGMASPDSDYDVRGFHLPSKAQYYDYRQHRDLIEIMDGDFDFVSFDLNKMFGLLAKSNPTVLEWVRAHIIYFNQFPEWENFKAGLLKQIDYKALYYHYLSLAKSGMQVMQSNNNFTYKKVFYSIRGLMSAEIASQHLMPELLITQLFDQTESNDPLRLWGENYLEIKKQQREKVQLPTSEQTHILTLLNNKIDALHLRVFESTHDIDKLRQHLTAYSFHLKQHFYG